MCNSSGCNSNSSSDNGSNTSNNSNASSGSNDSIVRMMAVLVIVGYVVTIIPYHTVPVVVSNRTYQYSTQIRQL